MNVYQLIGNIEWECTDTLMIADSYDKALNALVRRLNKRIYLGNVDGMITEEGPNVFRHHCDPFDIYTIYEVPLNEKLSRKNGEAIFQISRYGSFGTFVESSEFFKGKDFSVALLKSWNEVKNSWA